jgi:kynurenine formamidase
MLISWAERTSSARRTAMRILELATTAAALAPAAASCTSPARPSLAPSGPEHIVDLSHPFDADTIYWPAEGFRLTVDSKGWTERGFYYEANSFCTAEHGGTHLDAPVHFAEGQRSVDEIPLEQLVGPGVVVDVAGACARDRDHLVTVEELRAWEREHGRIPAGSIVLLRTGFGRFWPDRERYMGTSERGPAAVAKLHFPGLDPLAARWLVGERSIGAVGLDTPSIDHGPSQTFDAHQALFRANVPALENVASLELLPPSGFTVVALPMKIRGGSGGPVRIAAVLAGC